MPKIQPNTKYFQSKYSKLTGSSLEELALAMRRVYKLTVGTSRRKPSINSKCKLFKTPRVFLDLYWPHLNQKTPRERFRRMSLYECALDVIRNSHIKPIISKSSDGKAVYYRFYGITKDRIKFCVQIKEEVKTGQKYFMSAYPVRDK